MHAADTNIEKSLYSVRKCMIQINRTNVYPFPSNFIEMYNKE